MVLEDELRNLGCYAHSNFPWFLFPCGIKQYWQQSPWAASAKRQQSSSHMFISHPQARLVGMPPYNYGPLHTQTLHNISLISMGGQIM